MSKRLRYTDRHRPVDTTPPKVDIIMVQIRPDDHPWVEEVMQSIQEQTYAHLGMLRVDNQDRALTIGSAWNLAVQASDADLVLFIGDDDALTPDLVSCMVDGWQHLRTNAPNLVHLTTHCTVLDDLTKQAAHVQVQHTGMFLRQFLLDHPFDGELPRHVGIAKLRAISDAQRELQEPMSMAILHHYGYIFRQHPFMAGGRPMRIQPQSQPHAHR